MAPIPRTRDKERTRRRIIEVAARFLAEKGNSVSLGDIAEGAGVSKSGLTHHFPSREHLFAAITEHAIAGLRDEVSAQLDPSENRPGRLARAYVRALTGGSEVAMRLFAPSSLWTAIARSPAAEALCAADAEAWDDAFALDGLDPVHCIVVRLAAEGFAGSAGSPYLAESHRHEVRDRLLRMCEPDWLAERKRSHPQSNE